MSTRSRTTLYLLALACLVMVLPLPRVEAQLIPGRLGGVFTIPWQAPATPTDCSVAQYGFVGDTDTGLGYVTTNQSRICAGGITSVNFWPAAISLGGTSLLAAEAANHYFQRSDANAQRASWANTYISPTNYEAFSIDWQTVANVALVGTRTVATGTSRILSLVSQVTNAGDNYAAIRLSGAGGPFIEEGYFSAAGSQQSSGATGIFFQYGRVTSDATSGTNAIFAITPTYNQTSGSAANTDLLINRTETAVGSGTQFLANFQVGGASKFSVANTGTTTLASNAALVMSSRFVISPVDNGLLNLTAIGATFGVQLNAGSVAPTISSGGGTSPAIVSGARNSNGSVDIGTGGTASQIVIAFGAPAWTNSPRCTAWVETGTAGNVRAHGVTTTTTTMTIQAASAWAASSIVAWMCEGRI